MTLGIVGIALGALGAGEWSLDDAFDIRDDLIGTTGLLIAAVAGIGGAAAAAATCWRPRPRPADGDTFQAERTTSRERDICATFGGTQPVACATCGYREA